MAPELAGRGEGRPSPRPLAPGRLRAGLYLGLSLLALALLLPGQPAADVAAANPTGTGLRIDLDHAAHTAYGLGYPITFMLQLPAGASGLTANYRYDAAGAWLPVTAKTSADLFNGVAAARFEYWQNTLYLSLPFSAASDSIFVQVVNGLSQPVTVTYLGMPKYYDNRQAAVTISMDDFEAGHYADFTTAHQILTGWNLPHTIAVETGKVDATGWTTLQQWLNQGLLEVASHSRTHPCTDQDYVTAGGFASEITGSRTDLLTHLTVPGGTVPAFIRPCGLDSSSVRQAVVAAGYLADRTVGPPFTTAFPAWGVDGAYAVVPPAYDTWDWQNGGTSTQRDEANTAFDQAHTAGAIYHLMDHPWTGLWGTGTFLDQHLDHISGWPDTWYAGFGQLYLYHYVQERGVVAVSALPGGTPTATATATASATRTATASGPTSTASATRTATATSTSPAGPTRTATMTATMTATSTATTTATVTRTAIPATTSTATATTAAPPTPTPGGQGNLRFIAPVRVLDTRGAPFGPIGFTPAGQPVAAGQLADGSTTRFKLAGQSFGGTALPADLTGVLLNVTLVQAQPSGGFVTVYPGHAATPPNASTVNPGTAIAANFWVTAVAPAGGPNAGTIAVTSVGSVRDVVIDLVGYFSPSAPSTTGNLRFVSPVRVLDTRGAPFGPTGYDQAGNALNTPTPLQANTISTFTLANRGFGSGAGAITFSPDVSGILAHVTTIQASGSGGFVTLLPGGSTGTPGASTVNPSTPIAFNGWATGIPTAGPGAGQFSLYSTNTLDVVVDVVGYWAASNLVSTGSLSLVSPARVLDTRSAPFGPIGFTPGGSPIQPGALAPGTTTRYLLNGQSFAGGTVALPPDVKGALVNVTLVQAQPGGGYVTVFPGDVSAAPNTSTVNPASAIAASFWASGLPTGAASGNGTLAVTSIGESRDVLIDLLGYFR